MVNLSLCLNPCSTGITFLTVVIDMEKLEVCGLNPCSTGITFLTEAGFASMYLTGGLNPCSTGITFLTLKVMNANVNENVS